ncbi:MAG: tRNA (N(6)-L-threonylcarbamoyladenosine(37)-C(2))-methylthiotransferase [Candidatus Hermodarchaeota archaeon]
MFTFLLYNYGCTLNQAKAEQIRGILNLWDIREAKTLQDANVVIINTCIVKNTTEHKIYHQIFSIYENHPNKRLIVTGCLPEIATLRKKLPREVQILHHNRLEDLPAILNLSPSLLSKEQEETALHPLPRIRTNPLIGIIPIAQGCLSNCSYCIVNKVMGALHSFDSSKILQDVRNALRNGVKEIQFTAQDTAVYGKDTGTSLPELLKRTLKIPGSYRIRIGMMHPKHALEIRAELMQLMQRDARVYRFLHLPLQSGNNRILKEMNRYYTIDEYKDLVQYFRQQFNEFSISTDIIVGFPGETHLEFQDTMQIIQEIRPDIVNISRFGARPETKAQRMKKQILSQEKKQRSRELTRLCQEIALQKNLKYLNQDRICIILEKGNRPNQWKGRDNTYKPVIVSSSSNLLGKFIEVRISKVGISYLKGTLNENYASSHI